MVSQRAGRPGIQSGGVSAFIPNPLPPTNPPLELDGEMVMLLAEAERQLGTLNGLTTILPNPDLFVDMFVRKESLLSSQIEGTQASFSDVVSDDPVTEDQIEVSNYVQAMRHGLSRLKELPLCLRLICEIHGKLLATGRGSARNPGAFRDGQNWIGPANCTIEQATYVPPPVPVLKEALNDLEAFFHDETPFAPLLKIALIHAQFETIHPFWDGNGRVGRLLITFWLMQQKILDRPLLYLSLSFKRHRMEYYDRLNAIRLDGAWEAWVKFFLRCVAESSREAIDAARRILALQQKLVEELDTNPVGRHGRQILEALFAQPSSTRTKIAKALGGTLSSPTVGEALEKFVSRGILTRSEGKRNVVYTFVPYLAILEEGTL